MWRSRCLFIESCDVIIAVYLVAPRNLNTSRVAEKIVSLQLRLGALF